MKATFDTSHYEFSHGHTPRGRGSWAFMVSCESQTQKDLMLNPQIHGIVRAERDHDSDDGLILWVVGSCLYTEAKARVSHFLRGHFLRVDVSVAT